MLSQIKKHISKKANLALLGARTGLVLCTGQSAYPAESQASRLTAFPANMTENQLKRLTEGKSEPCIYLDKPNADDFALYNKYNVRTYLADLSRRDLTALLRSLELYAESPTLYDLSGPLAHETPISLGKCTVAQEPPDSELERAADRLSSQGVRVRYFDGTLKPNRLLTRAEALNMLTPREYFEAALESLADDGYIYRDIHISDPYAAAAIFSKDKGLFGSINLVPDSLMSGETLGGLLESLGFDCSLDGSAPITRRTAIIKLAAIL